ncbi:hypothetical protein Smp_088180 [Schistosoma mansoni]|uniref:hypothetical protein n=1 Tax=Schistosoma mansoni TaxID=6183 RepID=UPI0001A629E8|nr:hypothetical protein Smp_088180 [Schistosoma mansoni]|eukprot:XP_018646106.1 hypothetical protein Smp_088180 [Schistosoma mansoni]
MLHNHPCSSSWMLCDPWTRKLSAEEKEKLKPVILQSASVEELIECIKYRTGKQVTAADVKTMRAQLSTGESTQAEMLHCDWLDYCISFSSHVTIANSYWIRMDNEF